MAPSSCLPPWLDTITPSAPIDSVILASSGERMPLITTGPPHCAFYRAISSQFIETSHCSLMHFVIDMTELALTLVLSKFRYFIFRPNPTSNSQRVCIRKSNNVESVNFGGTTKPLCISRSRAPSNLVSTVTTNTLQCVS